MILASGELYHLYNQGNNRQKILFSHDNYLFFLKKMKLYLLPHADILAWCLMLNHFHVMIYVHTVEISIGDTHPGTHQMTESHQMSKKPEGGNTHQMTESHLMSNDVFRKQTINQSIAIMYVKELLHRFTILLSELKSMFEFQKKNTHRYVSIIYTKTLLKRSWSGCRKSGSFLLTWIILEGDRGN